MARPLAALLADTAYTVVAGDPHIAVESVVADSRQVQPGDVFVCLPGYRAEGGEVRADRHDFISQAVSRGAVAVVIERDDVAVPRGIVAVRVEHAWSAIAAMACALYDHPSQALRMVGVTGTSGKTSTTYFLDAVLRAAGLRTARFGTIEYRIADRVLPAQQTTPEAPELQRLLRQAADDGCDAVVMEVSSHALELRRVGGVAFDVGVFTNISQDHLNFHPDMHHYLRAKGRLFEELGSGGKKSTAVVNVDDPRSDHIIAVNRGALLTYAVERPAQVRATQIHSGLDGTRFLAHTPVGEIPISIPHIGEFHVHNALAALASGLALGIDIESIRGGLAAAPGVPGRFELVEAGQAFRVAVDYAHKPDALERLLRSARRLHPHRVITVFGCGGDRDRSKRPQMGRIAVELSDLVVVTSDNPRSEPPLQIIDEIVAGARQVPGSAEKLRIEPDRAAAIALAIAQAQPGDLVLIAGKGHETYQILADRRVDFDDREVARRAASARAGRAE